MASTRFTAIARHWLRPRTRNGTAPGPGKPALVFAPHQDDETLGCGGTIAIKRRSGTPVSVVFMTDGSGSHRQFVDARTLVDMRRDEATEACRILGVPAVDVHFLGFADGKLRTVTAEARAAVEIMLRKMAPAEVFVPFRFDGPSDHEVTYHVVTEAIRASGLSTRVFEYPVWHLNRWPWIPFNVSRKAGWKPTARALLRAGSGLSAWRHFRSAVDVRDVLDQKREALNAHRTQMIRMHGHPNWPTLSDVSAGHFLDCFFGDFEIYRVTEVSGTGANDKVRTDG